MFFQHHRRLLKLGEYYKQSNRSVNACDMTKIIRRQFPAADYSFKTHRDIAVDPDMIIVSGFYDCYNDAQGLPHTEITLCYYPDQALYFPKLLDWSRLSFDIAECIAHEDIHRRQYQNKETLAPYSSKETDPGKKREQEYLGDEAEIDAYGYSIAAEVMAFGCKYTDCNMYRVYREVFDNDYSVVLKLQKKISKYLIQLESEYAKGK